MTYVSSHKPAQGSASHVYGDAPIAIKDEHEERSEDADLVRVNVEALELLDHTAEYTLVQEEPESDREEDELQRTAEMTLKPSKSALDFQDGQDKLLYAEKVGKGLLDPNSARGDTRRIEDLKKIWR